ncbi:hypothetical protein KOM00_20135 [Geomonas sp. Red69]|uniref:hypothetical protein n=1 Tax=Geomonas diazotrophica TaxID=2843197 RepID=UPI001C10E480|nr:hypothetical protein [Geomonas diazotrophica]MBU5639034.1 hypothetical protein [Geomonas diazotrophica]
MAIVKGTYFKEIKRRRKMALVTEIKRQALERETKHTEADCTYDVIEVDGKRFLQLDTYGSAQREIKGKKSQSLRLSPEAIAHLKKIFLQHDL